MLGTPDDPGITRRSIAAVFDIISAARNRQFLLRASYIEIYNEVIRDLLVPDNDNLKIHEDVLSKRVFVDSMEEVVTSVDHVMAIISKGEDVRAVGETNMNDRSSRSHTIFSLKIESREMSLEEIDGQEPSDDGVAVRASTLSLVDLAGSERASFTKAQGMRLVEGGHINKSLLTLGTVINKLSSGEQLSSIHIPYRDSKLTRLLQPALGGNARTAIICAVTPAILHMEETLSTLKFASRAKKVTNSAKTNEFLDDRAKLRRAEKEIAQLKSECQRLKSGPGLALRAEPQSQSTSILPETADSKPEHDRVQAFEGMFQKLLQNMQNKTSLQPTCGKGSRKRSYDEMSQPSLANALHLFGAGELSDTGGKDEGVPDEIVTSLRHKLLDAEKQMHQNQSAINYERQAMTAEVEELVLSTDHADYARRVAERESAEAVAELGRAQVKSLVDEIVSEAMSVSLIGKDLRQSESKLAKLQNVNDNNIKLKDSLTTLQKEHSEVVRREKRGVGPVLKEKKFLQGKVSDLENKSRALREKSTRTTTEKASVERELKTLQRQNKVLSNEIEKHRNHISKGQDRLNRDLAEERKKSENASMELREEMSALAATLREREDKLSSTLQRLEHVEATLEEREENLSSTLKRLEHVEHGFEEVKLARGALADELDMKRKQLETRQSEETKLEASAAAKDDEIVLLTEEISKCHLELDETKSELSKVSSLSKQLECNIFELSNTSDASLREHQEVSDGLKTKLSEEKAAKEEVLAELAEVIEDQKNKFASKDLVIKEIRNTLESSNQENQDVLKTLQSRISNLEERENVLLTEGDAQFKECGKLREEAQELRECDEKLIGENVIRTKEVHKLQDALQRQARKVYDLEDTLDKVGRGEGPLAVQHMRVARRDAAIKELESRLNTMSKLLQADENIASLVGTERLISLEAKIACLGLEKRQLEKRLNCFEMERPAMIEEARKLRERIKERDSQRVKEAVSRKEKRYEVVKRRNEALRELPLNSNSQ